MVKLEGNPVAHLSEYELRHLVAHLEESGLTEDLHRLLALETDTHLNAWFEAKQAYDDIQGYLEDVNRAWYSAEKNYLPTEASQEARSIGLQIRYALITSSINTVLGSIPPKLLTALVEKDLWTSKRAFEYARHTSPARESIRQLAPYLDPQQLREAIILVWNLPEERQKWLQQLFDLAPNIIPDLLRQVLIGDDKKGDELLHSDFVTNTGLESAMGNALAVLAERISDDQVIAALRLAQVLQHNAYAALPALLSRLAGEGSAEEAIKIADNIWDSLWRVRAITAILSYLTENNKLSVIFNELYRVMQNSFLPERIELMTFLIPHLPLEEPNGLFELRYIFQKDFGVASLTRTAITMKALDASREIDDKLSRVKALACLAQVLPENDKLNVLSEALSLAKEIEPEYRYQTMQVLAEQLREPFWNEALDIVRSISDVSRRVWAIKPLIPHLPDKILPKCFELLSTLSIDSYQWQGILEVLAPRLKEPMLREVLKLAEIYPISEEVENELDNGGYKREYERERILEILAPYLPETLIRELLAMILQSRFLRIEPTYFGQIRQILVPQLARLGYPEEVMNAIREYKIELNAKVVAEIAPYVSENMLDELLESVKEKLSNKEYEWRESLNALAPYLSSTLLRKALQFVTIGDTVLLDEALGKTAHWLARLGYTQTAIDVTSYVGETNKKAAILREMIEISPETERSLIIREALKTARMIESTEERAEAITVLIPYISETEQISLVDELLSEMERQEQTKFNHSSLSVRFWLDRQIKLLTSLAEKLPASVRKPLITKALSLARENPLNFLPKSDPIKRFSELDADQQFRISLLLRLSEHRIIWRLVTEFLITWASEDTTNGINGLFGLLSWLSDFERISILMDTYRIGWEIQDTEQRAKMFVKLLPLYPQGFIPFILDQVLAAIRLIDDEFKEGVLLNEITAYVSEDERRKVLREIYRHHPSQPVPYEESHSIEMLVEIERNRRWTDSFSSIIRHFMRKIIRKTGLKFPGFDAAFDPRTVSKTFSEEILFGYDSDLRNRAQFLLHLSALLPEGERETILNEFLEIVRSMNQAYDKASFLLALFPLYPTPKRLFIFQEAAAEVWKCESISILFSSIRAIIPHLLDTEKPVIIPETLRLVLKGGEDNHGLFNNGFHLLEELLPYLSEIQIYETLDTLRSCPVENWKLGSIVIMAARLVELGHIDEGFALISEIPSQGFYSISWKSRGFAKIAFFLPEPLVRRALKIVQSSPAREAGDERARAIAALSFRLAKLGHTQEALTVLKESVWGSKWYALALHAMADLVSEKEHLGLRMDILTTVLSLTDVRARAECLDATISQWFDLPADTRYSLWKEWLHDSAAKSRTDLLADLTSLMPVVSLIGLGNALYEVGTAIRDVKSWWP